MQFASDDLDSGPHLYEISCHNENHENWLVIFVKHRRNRMHQTKIKILSQFVGVILNDVSVYGPPQNWEGLVIKLRILKLTISSNITHSEPQPL
jgi:hypothetical protein